MPKTREELLLERERIDESLRDLEESCHEHDGFLASMYEMLDEDCLKITMPMSIDLELIASYSLIDGSFNLDFDTCFDIDDLYSTFTSEHEIFNVSHEDDLLSDILRSFRNHLKCVRDNGEKVAGAIDEYAEKHGLDKDSLKRRFEDKHR